MIEALHVDDVQQALESLSNWRLETTPNHHIVREWSGQSFVQVFALMTEIANVAEEMNHHPDWCNSFRHLTIRLTTHDVGGLSRLDLEMAERIEHFIQMTEAQ
jgi:4a-hydroxytetrahydrobiopterin dehydratase